MKPAMACQSQVGQQALRGCVKQRLATFEKRHVSHGVKYIPRNVPRILSPLPSAPTQLRNGRSCLLELAVASVAASRGNLASLSLSDAKLHAAATKKRAIRWLWACPRTYATALVADSTICSTASVGMEGGTYSVAAPPAGLAYNNTSLGHFWIRW